MAYGTKPTPFPQNLSRPKWTNLEECRAYYEANLPHVKLAIMSGGCILCKSPYGVQAFGDLSQPFPVSKRFRWQEATGEAREEMKSDWPKQMQLGQHVVERVGDADCAAWTATYRIVQAD